MRFFLFLFSFLFPIFAFAQSGTTNTSSQNESFPFWNLPLCSDKFEISGTHHIKMNTNQEYGLRSKENNTAVLPYGFFELYLNSEKIVEKTAQREKLNYHFPEPGVYTLSLHLDSSVHGCRGNISEEIHVYREMIFYLGAEKSTLSNENLQSNFRQKSVLLQTATESAFKGEESLSIWNSMGNADIIVLNSADILATFTEMERLERVKENSFEWKNIFIISHQKRSFLSKVLASSVAKLGIDNVFLISEDNFNTLLNMWSYGDDRSATAWEKLSYEKKNFIFSMSSVLEFLVYSGVSYQFLGTLLMIAFVSLVFNILKQVIGLDIYMIHYPLLLAIILSQFGLKFTLAFIIISVVSLGLVRLVSSKIQLLINAKKAFLISVYVLMTLLVLGMDNLMNLNFFGVSGFESVISLLAILLILFSVEKILENMKIFSKSGFSNLLQYILIVVIIFAIFASKDLLYFLISYPDVIFLIVLVNLAVGRYTGLQLTEYIRFSPILKNINEEE